MAIPEQSRYAAIRRVHLLALAGLALAGPLAAQDTNLANLLRDINLEQAQADSFRLFTECAPMELAVLVLHDEVEDIGVTEERVRTMAESRLRAADLYGGYAFDNLDRDEVETLHMGVDTLSVPVYGTHLGLVKPLYDPATDLNREADPLPTGGPAEAGPSAPDA